MLDSRNSIDKVVTFHFTDDFIACLADYIDNHFVKQGVALSRLAIVFGGKRPALFLKRALAKRTKTSFISPCFFSIEEFIQYLISSKEVLRIATDLDVSFLIWQVARDRVPALLGERKTFADRKSVV